MYETLDRALTREEREWATNLFEETKLDRRLRNEPTSDENLRKAGLEARLNGDQDIKTTIKYLETAANSENRGLTYAILDVDKMSEINAKYGESVGDKILKYIRDTANRVLGKDTYYIGKPTKENQLTKGDQLILILNHAYLPGDDLNNLRKELKAKVVARVYGDLQLSFPSMPAEWQGLENEKVSVSIGYVAVRDARVQTKEGGDATCASAKLLRDMAIRQVTIAKNNGGDIIFGLN